MLASLPRTILGNKSAYQFGFNLGSKHFPLIGILNYIIPTIIYFKRWINLQKQLSGSFDEADRSRNEIIESSKSRTTSSSDSQVNDTLLYSDLLTLYNILQTSRQTCKQCFDDIQHLELERKVQYSQNTLK